MDETLLPELRAGKQATFIVFETPEQGTGIPLTLAGFGDGFRNLP
jgi:invasion protein IalB